MANQPTTRYAMLVGGLATTRHPTAIGPDQCPSILNFQFDRGVPAKRRGWVKLLAASVKDACLDFSGDSAQYALSPHCGSDLDIASNFTIEAVIQRSPFEIGVRPWEPLIGKGSWLDSVGSPGWTLAINSNQIPRFVYIKSGGGQVSLGFTGSTPYGVTRHLAVSRSSTKMFAYVDGVKDASATVAAAPVATNKAALILASSAGSASRHFWGKIQEVRVWKVARTLAQIAANDDKELAAGDTASLAGYWKLNTALGCYDSNQVATGMRVYRSPSPPVWVDGLVQGKPSGTQQSGPRDFGLEFDGWEDYLEIPKPPDDPWGIFRGQATGSKTWSVEARVKPKCVPASTESADTIAIYGTVAKPAFHVYESAGKYVGKVEDSAGTEFVVVSTTGAVDGTAAHVALGRSGTKIYLAINGALEASTTLTGNQFGASVGLTTPFVGSRGVTVRGVDGKGFVGAVDEVRFWRSYRSPALLNKYKAADLPDVTDSNLILYYKFNEGMGTEIADHSKSRANGRIYPAANVPVWNAGMVTPNSPPTVDAVFDYQKRGGVAI